MIEKNKGEEIVEILGNPKRAKNLFALNKRLERCEMMIKDNEGKLTHQDFKVINDYKKDCAIQENALITELKKLELKNSNLTPQQFTKQRMELMDKHQERYRQIISGNYEGTIIDKNIQKNSEDIVMDEELNKEFDRLFPPLTPTELAEVQQKTLWSDGVHIPGIHPPVEKLNPIVYIDGQSFLTNQNISMIQASPGTGKSAICESILSNVLNKECEHIGLYVDESIERAVFFDCERDLSLIDESNERMLQRANVKEHNSKAIIVGLRKSFSLKLKKARIIQVIEHIKPQIILIDGIGDLVEDTNSIQETTVIYLWLIELITKYNLSVIVTLHPNKGKDTARGHIGSEMLRRCEGIIEVKENLEGIRTMSVTKARSSEKTKASFKWCKESKRMISCDVKQGNTKKPSIFNSLTEFDIEKLKQGIGFDIKHKPGEIVDIKERIVIGYSFTPLKVALQKYLREEHPGVNTGTNHIEIFIRDLCFENKHLLKSGKSGNSTYIFQNIVEEDIIVKSEEKE
jgi:nucleoside-triphosphatase THEP1